MDKPFIILARLGILPGLDGPQPYITAARDILSRAYPFGIISEDSGLGAIAEAAHGLYWAERRLALAKSAEREARKAWASDIAAQVSLRSLTTNDPSEAITASEWAQERLTEAIANRAKAEAEFASARAKWASARAQLEDIFKQAWRFHTASGTYRWPEADLKAELEATEAELEEELERL